MVCVPLENTHRSPATFEQNFKISDSITVQSDTKSVYSSASGSNKSSSNNNEITTDKTKLTKGLKNLSLRVREIVNECQWTTYKEVAEVILKDFLNLEQPKDNQKLAFIKEEQNIKRRVYDALNVLISAEVLLKEGKRVKSNNKSKNIRISDNITELTFLKLRIVKLLETKAS